MNGCLYRFSTWWPCSVIVLCIPQPQPFQSCTLVTDVSFSSTRQSSSLREGDMCSMFGHSIEKSLNSHLLKKSSCGLSSMEMRPWWFNH